MLAAGIAVIFTAGQTDFFLSGPTPAERIAATVAASPAEEDPSALDVSLADVRAENSHADSPAATDAGKARKRLDLAEVQAALRALDDAPRGADTERRERELVDRWSELDPAGAAAYAAEVFQQGGSEGIFRRAAQAFARHNPATASAWAAALGAPMLRDTALREIYRTWSESDPMAAAASIGLLPIGSAQSIAATLVGSRLAEQNLATALQWVSQIGGSTQAASMRGAVSKWATSDPSAAAAWISRQTSPALRREGMQLLAQDWVGRDPAGALAYGQSIENADLRESFMRSAISRYGRNDPLAAAAWIATPGGGALRRASRARDRFAMGGLRPSFGGFMGFIHRRQRNAEPRGERRGQKLGVLVALAGSRLDSNTHGSVDQKCRRGGVQCRHRAHRSGHRCTMGICHHRRTNEKSRCHRCCPDMEKDRRIGRRGLRAIGDSFAGGPAPAPASLIRTGLMIRG